LSSEIDMPYRETNLTPPPPSKPYRTFNVELPWYRFGRPYSRELITMVPYVRANGKDKGWVADKTVIKYCRSWEIYSHAGTFYEFQLMNGFFSIFSYQERTKHVLDTHLEWGFVHLWTGPDFGSVKYKVQPYGGGKFLKQGKSSPLIEVQPHTTQVELLIGFGPDRFHDRNIRLVEEGTLAEEIASGAWNPPRTPPQVSLKPEVC